mmetsp:Transcript_38283/g.89921  ORF Transcript_38283/g.89921 Transcript_38283/m.89921 type:complete len:211 (-) Transcript_38283:335-967(-)
MTTWAFLNSSPDCRCESGTCALMPQFCNSSLANCRTPSLLRQSMTTQEFRRLSAKKLFATADPTLVLPAPHGSTTQQFDGAALLIATTAFSWYGRNASRPICTPQTALSPEEEAFAGEMPNMSMSSAGLSLASRAACDHCDHWDFFISGSIASAALPYSLSNASDARKHTAPVNSPLHMASHTPGLFFAASTRLRTAVVGACAATAAFAH